MKKADDVQPGALALIYDAVKRLFADEAVPLAGNIAFRVLFSTFPFLIFLTALAGFFGSSEQAESVVNFMLSVAPNEIIRPLVPEIHSILTVPHTGLLSLGALITVWSALAGVDSVRVGLNRAYGLKDTRPFWVLYLQNIIFVVGTAGFLLAFSVLIVFAPIGIAFVRNHAEWLAPYSAIFDEWRYPTALLLLIVGLTIAHLVLPARRLRWRDIWPGVVLTVLVWIALAAVYASYLSNIGTFAITYAGLSGLFAAMFFLYLSALVLIFGGEVNREIMLRRDNR